jgi:endonuclease/exonuclease/phosphatase family metal-dependent hydrolase
MYSKMLIAFAISMVAVTHAANADPVKVVSYNLGSGGGTDMGPIDFDALATQILVHDPDIVVLQEVHENWPSARYPQIAQPDYWRTRLNMNGHYKPNSVAWNFWGTRLGSAGTMILSKWPIVRVDEDRQASTRGGVLGFGIGFKVLGNDKMSVVVDFRGKPLRVAAMHMDFLSDDPGTLLNNYSTWLEKFAEPRILVGDANMTPDHFVISATTRARYEILNPNQGIDWVMARIGSGVAIVDGGLVFDPNDHPSDHGVVYATVELGVAPPPPPPPTWDPILCFDPVRRKLVPCEGR